MGKYRAAEAWVGIATYWHINGDEVGRVLYDGFGGVLTSPMSITLTGALPGTPDAATGLVHQGGGRWYDYRPSCLPIPAVSFSNALVILQLTPVRKAELSRILGLL